MASFCGLNEKISQALDLISMKIALEKWVNKNTDCSFDRTIIRFDLSKKTSISVTLNLIGLLFNKIRFVLQIQRFIVRNCIQYDFLRYIFDTT